MSVDRAYDDDRKDQTYENGHKNRELIILGNATLQEVDLFSYFNGDIINSQGRRTLRQRYRMQNEHLLL
jgi:hypothetical protein